MCPRFPGRLSAAAAQSFVLTCCVILGRSSLIRSTNTASQTWDCEALARKKNTGFQVLDPLIIYLPERCRLAFYGPQQQAFFKFQNNLQQIISWDILAERFNIAIKHGLLACINVFRVEAGVRTGPSTSVQLVEVSLHLAACETRRSGRGRFQGRRGAVRLLRRGWRSRAHPPPPAAVGMWPQM